MTKQLADTVKFRHGAKVTNRFVQPAMLTNSGVDDGYVTQDTIDYYAARSRSAGMIIVEYSYVSEAEDHHGPGLMTANNWASTKKTIWRACKKLLRS